MPFIFVEKGIILTGIRKFSTPNVYNLQFAIKSEQKEFAKFENLHHESNNNTDVDIIDKNMGQVRAELSFGDMEFKGKFYFQVPRF